MWVLVKFLIVINDNCSRRIGWMEKVIKLELWVSPKFCNWMQANEGNLRVPSEKFYIVPEILYLDNCKTFFPQRFVRGFFHRRRFWRFPASENARKLRTFLFAIVNRPSQRLSALEGDVVCKLMVLKYGKPLPDWRC